MIEINQTDEGNLEISILNRKEFKQKSETTDVEELINNSLSESGYYYCDVQVNDNELIITCNSDMYSYKETNKTIISELNKYGFAVFNKI